MQVAAIEQLEESKNTIENLLDWLSNVDKEAEHSRKFKQAIEQNGTHFEEGDLKALEGDEDDVNGNLLEIQQDIETQVDGLVKSTEDNLNQQYQKVKVLLLGLFNIQVLSVSVLIQHEGIQSHPFCHRLWNRHQEVSGTQWQELQQLECIANLSDFCCYYGCFLQNKKKDILYKVNVKNPDRESINFYREKLMQVSKLQKAAT